jgi:hypothetical protein
MHGSSLLGDIPDFAHSEAVALARSLKCKLIAAGNGAKPLPGYRWQCGIPINDIASITAVA